MAHDIPAPMLAKPARSIPAAGGLSFEPKWDGFRGLISWDGTDAEIGSRGSKPLTRYFPELVAAAAELLPEPCLLDGEIVVPVGDPGSVRLDWEALSARIHPAESRVAMLAAKTPALFIAFDILARDGQDLMTQPFSRRRAELVDLCGPVPRPFRVTRATEDREVAMRWFDDFEGAGLDGLIAKPLADPYSPGKRALLKVKHSREVDVVAMGYRVHASGSGVGALLVGLYNDVGELHQVGGVSAFTDARRRELIAELAPLVERDDDGSPARAESDRGRFSGGKDRSFVRLRPERVLQVRYDQWEAGRFRHTVQFERWRPDRDPRSCTVDQVETAVAYDLDAVLET